MNALATRTAGVSLTREMLLALRLASKSITRFILNGLAISPNLEPLGTLILAFASGTAASTALHHYMRRSREHRARIELAVFLVISMVETSPQYHTLLDHPENLLHMLDDQVMPVLKAHLNEGEARTAMTRLKRKVYEDTEEPRAVPSKRRRVSTPDRIMVSGDAIVHNSLEQMTPPSLEPTPSSVVDTGITLAVIEADIQAQLLPEWCEEENSGKESIEDQPEEHQTPSGQHTTEVRPTNSSQGTSTPQQAPFSSQGSLPESDTTSSDSQTPVAPSVVTGSTSVPVSAMPPPSLFKPSVSSKVPRVGLRRRVSSPTPARRRVWVDLHTSPPPGYGLDYNDRRLYPTPTPSNSTSAASNQSSDSGRPQSHAAVRFTTTIDGSKKSTENIAAHIQHAFDENSAASSRRPHTATTTHGRVEGQQDAHHLPLVGGGIEQTQTSTNEVLQATPEKPSSAASGRASVEAHKKQRRTKKNALQTSLPPKPVYHPATSDDDFAPETSSDDSTAPSTQRSIEPAKKKKLGRSSKHVTQTHMPSLHARDLSASHNHDQFLQEVSANAPAATPTSAQSTAKAPKKKLGRPRKDATLVTPVHDPIAPVPKPAKAISTPKRRGRPPKTPVLLASK